MPQTRKHLLDDRYEVTRQLSRCGETVVYLGRDKASDQMVTIREFFADTLMNRESNGRMSVLPGCEVQYKSLTNDYEELCRYLMELQGEVPLIRPLEVLWRNNTIYSIERYRETETLEDYLSRKGDHLSWPVLKRAIGPIVSLLSRMHAEGIYHRGISPETILVDSEGNFLLSGFCIPPARTIGSEIAATLYFGYSAPEQYASNSWQGSWSDVYSLAAVCYRALTGATPVEWRQRGAGRELSSVSSRNRTVPKYVSDAIDSALSIDLRSRYRTIEEFWSALLTESGSGGTVTYRPPTIEKRTNKPADSGFRKFLVPVACVMLVVVLMSFGLTRHLGSTSFPTQQPIHSQPADPLPDELGQQDDEPEIVVPNLQGQNIETVLMDPLYQKLFHFRIERVFSEEYPVGDVVDQQPQAGADPGEDATIMVLVSKGTERATVPDVVSMTLDEAMNLLEELEITYRVEGGAQGAPNELTVTGQSMTAGSILYRMTDTVMLTVVPDGEVH